MTKMHWAGEPNCGAPGPRANTSGEVTCRRCSRLAFTIRLTDEDLEPYRDDDFSKVKRALGKR